MDTGLFMVLTLAAYFALLLAVSRRKGGRGRNDDFFRARAVAFLRAHRGKLGLIQLRGNNHFLPFLHVQPRARQQFGIIFENRFLHRLTL